MNDETRAALVASLALGFFNFNVPIDERIKGLQGKIGMEACPTVAWLLRLMGNYPDSFICEMPANVAAAYVELALERYAEQAKGRVDSARGEV